MMRKRNTQREATARRDTSTILLIVVFVSVFLASALFWYINDRERFVTQEALVLDKYFFASRDTVYKIVYNYNYAGKNYTSSDGVLENQKDAWTEISIGDSVVVFVNMLFPNKSIWDDTRYERKFRRSF